MVSARCSARPASGPRRSISSFMERRSRPMPSSNAGERVRHSSPPPASGTRSNSPSGIVLINTICTWSARLPWCRVRYASKCRNGSTPTATCCCRSMKPPSMISSESCVTKTWHRWQSSFCMPTAIPIMKFAPARSSRRHVRGCRSASRTKSVRRSGNMSGPRQRRPMPMCSR